MPAACSPSIESPDVEKAETLASIVWRLSGSGRRRALALGIGVLVGAVAGPACSSAQSLSAFGARAGAGVDFEGKLLYDAQLDLTDLTGSTAVAVAVRGFGEASSTKAYQSTRISRTWENYEEMSIWGVIVMADVLLHHGREARGPYVALGLGLGPIWYDWRLESTDPRVGEPLPAGGSFVAQDGVILGSMLSAGLGQRLGEHLDLRAEATVVLVPSTDQREDLAFVPFFTLTTGFRP